MVGTSIETAAPRARHARSGRRFLLLYVAVSSGSGHHQASTAIERTLRAQDPDATVASVDAFRYASPFVRWAISHTYSSLIRHQPDVWEYLYDNPGVHRRMHYFRALLHRYQAGKLRRLLERFQPDVIACTQAYPCGILADFKTQYKSTVPLVGVLTDYAPHVYWFHETVDRYVVPSPQVKRRFELRGIDANRVEVLGIPIDPRFNTPVDRQAEAQHFGLDPDQPIILIMGGGGGFGQLRDIVANLDTLPSPCQLVIVAGTNRALLLWARTQRFRHRVLTLGYTDRIPELMSLATLLVSKPGGLTTSEALAKHLPLVIVNPIPGQEAYNARYLLSQGAAVQAGAPEMVRQTVRDLLENPEQLDVLRKRNAELARPFAAEQIGALLCRLADQRRALRSAPQRAQPIMSVA